MKQALLITRPLHQAQSLALACRAASIEPFLAPALTIEPHEAMPYDRVDVMIVTSANAVRWGKDWLEAHQGALLAVGQATQKALETAGYRVTFCPQRFDSEHLLAWPGWAQFDSLRVGLLKGLGGRALLKDTLLARGAKVVEWCVYQRRHLAIAHSVLQAFVHFPGDRFVLASSGAVLESLEASILAHDMAEIRAQPLLVFSQPAFIRAQQLGWKRVKIADLSNESSIINWILESR